MAAAHKHQIFGIDNIGDTKIAAPEIVQTAVQAQNQDKTKPGVKSETKLVSKDSNLGVKLTLKKVTKSPVPDILPGLLPNQPVTVLGAPTATQPINFNPAITHPATINPKKITNKKTPFKPEITHPAVLPQPLQEQVQLQPVLIPTAEKVKLGNFKERLAKKNQKSKKTNKKNNKNPNARKSTKSKKEPSAKKSIKMIFE